MIQINNLHKRFGDLKVLTGVDLTIPTGQCMVILGRSGCGKSVLLKHIVGLMKPDAGTLFVEGKEVPKLDYNGLAVLRREMGVLFQMAALFDSMTVGENIGLALRERKELSEPEIKAVVTEKLSLVGLPGIEDIKPADLSGGMRKRVGLARAIAEDPAYILYDEPTTGLDPITAQQINILIQDLQKKLNITSVVVTHDMTSANFIGDRLCLLHHGKVVFEGSPRQMQESSDPSVRQFIHGEAFGPLTLPDSPYANGGGVSHEPL